MVLEFDEDGSGGVELDELEKIILKIVRNIVIVIMAV